MAKYKLKKEFANLPSFRLKNQVFTREEVLKDPEHFIGRGLGVYFNIKPADAQKIVDAELKKREAKTKKAAEDTVKVNPKDLPNLTIIQKAKKEPTEKEALQAEASELGVDFNDRTTIAELKELIAGAKAESPEKKKEGDLSEEELQAIKEAEKASNAKKGNKGK